MADFSRVAGKVYIKLAGNQITETTKNGIESELLNWDCFNLTLEKFQIIKTQSDVLICTKGYARENSKKLSGGGFIVTVDKFNLDYFITNYHNTLCDIAIYNEETSRLAAVYKVVIRIDFEFIANTNIKMLVNYELTTDYKRTYWDLLEFSSLNNAPLVELKQFDYTNIVAEILDTGSTEITESGFVFAENINPTTSDTKIEVLRNSKGFYYYNHSYDYPINDTYARAYAINSNGTSYSQNIKIDGFLYTQFLEDLDDLRNNLNSNFKLERNLDFNKNSSYRDLNNKTLWTTGTGWTPINAFAGSLDGSGFSISNLFIDNNTDYNGLFGDVDGATIENLILSNINIISTGNKSGGLGGNIRLGSVINNVVVSGSISGVSSMGGLVGENSGTISNCNSSVTVTGTGNYNGGLVGFNNFVIENCYATGNVISALGAGGLAGVSDGSTYIGCSISNCYATGNTESIFYTGGLLGNCNSSIITNCYSIGFVTGAVFQGGLIGASAGNTITSCYYNSETSGQSDNTGKGVPKTATEMKLEATYIDWDFTTVWQINTGQYPTLR